MSLIWLWFMVACCDCVGLGVGFLFCLNILVDVVNSVLRLLLGLFAAFCVCVWAVTMAAGAYRGWVLGFA